MFIEESKKL